MEKIIENDDLMPSDQESFGWLESLVSAIPFGFYGIHNLDIGETPQLFENDLIGIPATIMYVDGISRMATGRSIYSNFKELLKGAKNYFLR